MFYLAERTEPARPQRGSPRMFRSDFVERHLSRVRPWQIVALWGPVAAMLLAYPLARGTLGALSVAGLALGGLFVWTLLEYVLHRFVFHFAVNPGSELQRDLYFLIHGVHHDYPYDADRLVMPPLGSLLIALVLAPPIYLALGPVYFPAAFAGLIAGYLWYDLTHYAVHHWHPRTVLGRLQRRNHLVHHFQGEPMFYGVTTPLWDLIFGTYAAHRSSQEGAAH
jgi:sterol desaturase/sphingolipid hydroxylase (fatty acid hydroxylase superfamily)